MITRFLAGLGLLAVAACGNATAAPIHHTHHTHHAARYVQVIAHRTDAGHAPENTVAGIWKGAEQGADRVEFDVQETRDHKLVLMHDVTLTRTTNVEQVYPRKAPWRVGDFTLRQLRRLDAGHGERVPTLGEALAAAWHTGLGVLLECKDPQLYPDMAARITAALKARPYWDTTDPDRLLVTSLDWGFLKRLHKHVPYRLDPIAIKPVTRAQIHSVTGFAWAIGVRAADVTPTTITQVRAEGLHLNVGETNTTADMRRILALRPYAISSNTPDQVVALEHR
ncbi:MAG: glycerophosphodiester phosphodiesterase [Actinoallomurus sp.]